MGSLASRFLAVLRSRRLRRILGYGGLALVALVLVAYLFRGPLFARPLGDFAARKLSEAMGGEFAAGAVSGSWLTDAVLIDLRTVRPPTTGPLVNLSWQRLEATYSLIDILRGGPLSGLHSLRIAGLDLEIDLTRPPRERRAGKPDGRPRNPFDLPLDLPALAVSGHLRVRAPVRAGGTATLDVGAFSFVSDGSHAGLTLERLTIPEWGWSQAAYRLRLERPAPETFRISSSESLAGIAL
nr:hypothetical protein [Planctomycetota bacterium]